MRRAAIAELKARLSHYLDQVKGGEEVVVTERGRPVARLVPLLPADRSGSHRERLLRAGLLIPGRGRLRPTLLRTPAGRRLGRGVLDALLVERREPR
jgi:prevent-host-death family protein